MSKSENTIDTFEVDTHNILRLSEIDKKILGLPDHYTYEIYIQSVGILNQSSFKFQYDFYDFVPNGNLFSFYQQDAIININDRQYLLSENQYLVCKALNEFITLPETERTFPNNLKHFAQLKTLAKDAASIDGCV